MSRPLCNATDGEITKPTTIQATTVSNPTGHNRSDWNLQPQEQTNPVTQQLLQAQLQLPLCEFSKGRLVHAWSQHQDE